MTKEGGNILVVSITDTSPWARAVQLEVHKEMSGEQRLLLAFQMSEFSRELTKQGIRKQHADWPETRVLQEVLRLASLSAALPLPLR